MQKKRRISLFSAVSVCTFYLFLIKVPLYQHRSALLCSKMEIQISHENEWFDNFFFCIFVIHFTKDTFLLLTYSKVPIIRTVRRAISAIHNMYSQTGIPTGTYNIYKWSQMHYLADMNLFSQIHIIVNFITLGWKVEDSDLTHFFKEMNKMKKCFFEIKPPLTKLSLFKIWRGPAHCCDLSVSDRKFCETSQWTCLHDQGEISPLSKSPFCTIFAIATLLSRATKKEERDMPCPFTDPKMFSAGPNFLCHTKRWFPFSKFGFCGSTKILKQH